MRLAKKRQILFQAFCLGQNSRMELEYISSGKVRPVGNGTYEVFSVEAKDGKGEIAHSGDYVKLDSNGNPYPNSSTFFERNCIQVGENQYRQISTPVEVWFADEPICEVVSYLLLNNRLQINEGDQEHYFRAELWGAPLSSARNAAVVAYSVSRNAAGKITDVDFNFVERSEFDRTYEWC